MTALLRIGSVIGLALLKALLTIFSSQVIEKGLAVVAFKSLRWLAARTPGYLDNDMVKDMEIAYYGEERYAKVFNRTPTRTYRGTGHQFQDPRITEYGAGAIEPEAGRPSETRSGSSREVPSTVSDTDQDNQSP